MSRLHVGVGMRKAEKTEGAEALERFRMAKGRALCHPAVGTRGKGQSQRPSLAEELPENKVLRWERCQPQAAGSVRQEVGTGWKLAAADSSPGTCGEVEHSEAEPGCQQASVATCQPYLIPTPSLPVPSFPVLTHMSPMEGLFQARRAKEVRVLKSHSFLYQEPPSSCQVPYQAEVQQLLSPACRNQTDTDGHMPDGLRAIGQICGQSRGGRELLAVALLGV